MAKKITLIMFVLLIASAFVFVSCDPEAGGGGNKPTPVKPADKDPIEVKLGQMSDNLVYNGDFENAKPEHDFSSEDATIEIVEDGSNKALSVIQVEPWGDVPLDITEYYGRGKSYLISAKFKNNGSTREDYLDAHVSFTVVSGAVMEAVKSGQYKKKNGDPWEAYYDCDDIYQGSWYSDALAYETFGIETNAAGVELSDTEYVEVTAILDAQTIENLLVDTTTKYTPGKEPTMAKLLAVFYVGNYDADGGQSGYSYYLDDVVIKDLNSELERQGLTYIPEAPADPDPEPEEEEEEFEE